MKYFILIACLSFASLYAQALIIKDGTATLEKLSDYSECQTKDDSGQSCHAALLRWVEAHPGDAFEAGHMTRLKMNAAAAMPFFAQAFKAGKGQCDNDVKLATVAALDLSPSQDAKNIAAAQEIAFGSCFTAFKPDLIENVSKSHPNFLTNACKGLNEKKVLQGIKAAWCKKT